MIKFNLSSEERACCLSHKIDVERYIQNHPTQAVTVNNCPAPRMSSLNGRLEPLIILE